MHRLSPAFVLGFYGCDKSIGDKLLAGEKFKNSENVYDWLGAGIYFWQSNPRRGLEWAIERSKRPSGSRIKEPFVVGAVIDLGFCLDLTTSEAAVKIKAAYNSLKKTYETAGRALPKNKHLRPLLDCAVINWLHDIRKKGGDEPFQSVKGVFIEGDPVYPDANFKQKTHIQIAVRDPKCIKGVFRVSDELLSVS